MSSFAVAAQRPPPLVNWPRVRTLLLAAPPVGALISIESSTSWWIWLIRALVTGAVALLAFGLAERWPARLPGWVGRWAWQLIVLAAAMPIGAVLAYWITVGGNPRFGENPMRVSGLLQLTLGGAFLGLWIAMGAMVKQREALAREQAHAFELERSELARQALDARMKLLYAQVQPHFLFNTLANVQALVETGSPQAPRVLASLVAYLRAAVPRLDESESSIAHEVDLVRAYLELMQLRMPDRLQYTLHADPAVLQARCPPTCVLTLVENAVRHGIDPAEDGGRIDVRIEQLPPAGAQAAQDEGMVRVRVTDTGLGLRAESGGLGTGLASLRERLQFTFGAQARLVLTGNPPRGTCAEVEFPLQRSTR
jgi:signal transduction histidine kinase